MEGIDEGLAAEHSELRGLIAREAPALLRFAVAALGSADEALALVESVLVRVAAAGTDEAVEAWSKPRLFAAVRRGAAQRLEQRRRTLDTSRLAPHPLVEKV